MREHILLDSLTFLAWGVIPFAIFFQIALPMLMRIVFSINQPQDSLLLIVGTSIAVLLPLCCIFLFFWTKLIRHSSKCPIWLYAEQLNPEQLKIYHFRKPPTIIKLAESSLDTKTKLKHYTTITITDKATEISAILGFLTPEEYDRFMQYWNAANPQNTQAS